MIGQRPSTRSPRSRTGLGGIDIRGRFEDSHARVIDNVLEGIALRSDATDETIVLAISLAAATEVAVSGNLLRNFATDRGPLTGTGIQIHAADITHSDGNQLVGLGPEDEYAGEVIAAPSSARS